MINLTPIGYVRSPRSDLSDDGWDAIESRIEVCPDFSLESLQGIEEFSHIEVIFLFDRVPETAIERGARHPRGNTSWPRIGIFAQRGKNRPNRLGVSVARLVYRNDRLLTVLGLDAIDGTPVLDIKPVMREFLPRGEISQPAWSHELMSHYWH
jgi:tRNA-Thr(GGU) m(6)t(6)A37 methyltransferase TsaA